MTDVKSLGSSALKSLQLLHMYISIAPSDDFEGFSSSSSLAHPFLSLNENVTQTTVQKTHRLPMKSRIECRRSMGMALGIGYTQLSCSIMPAQQTAFNIVFTRRGYTQLDFSFLSFFFYSFIPSCHSLLNVSFAERIRNLCCFWMTSYHSQDVEQERWELAFCLSPAVKRWMAEWTCIYTNTAKHGDQHH